MNWPRSGRYWQCFFTEKASAILAPFFAQCKIKNNITMFVLHQNEWLLLLRISGSHCPKPKLSKAEKKEENNATSLSSLTDCPLNSASEYIRGQMDFNSLKKVQIVSKMDANLVTNTSVAQSAFVTSAMSSVPNTSSLIFLDNSIILPNDQPDILQQALAEVALPSSVSVTSSPTIIPNRVPIQANKVDAKENFVTVYNSGDGTLRLTKENARALGIGISSNEGRILMLLYLE